MSFAMDDIRQVSDVQKLQSNPQTQSLSKSSEDLAISSHVKDSTSENIEFSDKFDYKSSTLDTYLIQKQEQISSIDKASQDMESIKKSFAEAEKQAELVKKDNLPQEDLDQANKQINQSLENIDKTAKESKFNNQKLLDGSMSANGIETMSLETFNFSADEKIANKADAKQLQEKIQKATEEIEKRQNVLQGNSQKLVSKVDSLVSIDLGKDNVDVAEYEKVEIIKNNIQKEIFKSPEKSVKMQIKHLNKDILLAMLSL